MKCGDILCSVETDKAIVDQLAAVIGPDGDTGYTLLADEATGLLGDGSAAFFWS